MLDLLFARCREGDLSLGGGTILGLVSIEASCKTGGLVEGGGGLFEDILELMENHFAAQLSFF